VSLTGRQVAEALADMIGKAGFRVAWYVPDSFRPPGVVIGQPSVDFAGSPVTFCTALWRFPVTMIVPRASERDAQAALQDGLHTLVEALHGPAPAGVFQVRCTTADPVTAQVAGQELPGYTLNVDLVA
jgi:hypothetical protein